MNGLPGGHDRHDRYLVAALAADDLEPAARGEAETLIASCRDCAALHADLRAIAAATASLPAPARTRDFRLTPADAARLRPTGWRAVVDMLAGARFAFTRPLATGLATIGLVGLLATTIPGALSGLGGAAAASPAGAPVSVQNGGDSRSVASAAATDTHLVALGSPAASSVPYGPGQTAKSGGGAVAAGASPSTELPPTDQGPVPAPSPASGGGGNFGAVGGSPSGGAAEGASGGGSATENGVRASTAASPLLVGSLVCLALGAALFAVRWAAARLAGR